MSDNAPNENMPALSVNDLTHHFGKFCALQSATLQVFPGDFTVLLGLNGAGKTTLYSLVTRLYNNRSGSIKIFDSDLHRQSSQALSKIGVVFQQPTLDLDLTVEQNLYYYSALHGMSKRSAQERMKEELSRMQILDQLKKRIRELSGGLRRRVEIARALLHKPKMLLLDEPSLGIAPKLVNQIFVAIKNINKEKKVTIFLVEQNAKKALELADRGYVLVNGNVTLEGTGQDLLKNKDIQAAYLEGGGKK